MGKTVPRATAAINAFWHPDVYSLISQAVRVLSLTSVHQQVWTGTGAYGGVISLLTWRRSFLVRHKPTPLHRQRYRGDLFKVSGNSVLCFGIDWFASWQFALRFSHRYGWKHPAESLCLCTVLFVKQMIPRQVHCDRKPISMWQSHAYVDVLSLILRCAGLLFQSGPGYSKGTQRRWVILGGALCLVPKTAESI